MLRRENYREIEATYNAVYKFLYDEDCFHIITNRLYPVYVEAQREGFDDCLELNRILGDMVLSDRELATALVTLFLYSDDLKKFVLQKRVDDMVRAILHIVS